MKSLCADDTPFWGKVGFAGSSLIITKEKTGFPSLFFLCTIEEMRLFKQVIFGIIFILLGGLIIYVLISVLFPSNSYPSYCYDGVQNRQEEGIDCGGLCTPCQEDTNTIRVLSKKLFPTNIGTGLVVEVQNPDIEKAIKSFAYKIDLKDLSGIVIETFDGTSFLYKGEIKHLIFPSLPFSFGTITSVDVNTLDTEKVISSEFQKPNVITRSIRLTDNPVNINGSLVNNEAVSFNNVVVYGLLYNRSGTLVGASKTNIDNIGSLETIQFNIVFSPDLSIQKQESGVTTMFETNTEKGDSGETVSLLQGILRELGFLQRDPTGFFDAATEEALKEFQLQNNISQTGALDNETRFILNQTLANQETSDTEGHINNKVDPTKTKIFVEVKR